MKKINIYAPLALNNFQAKGNFCKSVLSCNVSQAPFVPSAKLYFNSVSMRLWLRIYQAQETKPVKKVHSAQPLVKEKWIMNLFFKPNAMKQASIIVLFLFISVFSFSQTTIKEAATYIDSTSKVTAVSENEKYIWIGTDHGIIGVNKKNKKTFHLTKSNSVLPADYITSVCCRKDGNVWVGTLNGILRYDGYTFMLVNSENSGLPDALVTSIVEDKNGNLWIGTFFGGLVKVHNNKYSVYNLKNSSVVCNCVYNLSTDDKGIVSITFLKKDEIITGKISAEATNLKITLTEV